MKKISTKNILKKIFKSKNKKKITKSKTSKIKKVAKAKASKIKNVTKAKISKIKKINAKKIKKKAKVNEVKIETKIENLRIPKNNEIKPEIKKVKKQETEKKEYKIKDYIVYPKHGVGQISEFNKINIGGIDVETFIIKFSKDKAS